MILYKYIIFSFGVPDSCVMYTFGVRMTCEQLQKLVQPKGKLDLCSRNVQQDGEYTVHYETWIEHGDKWDVEFLNDECLEFTSIVQFPKTLDKLIKLLSTLHIVHPSEYDASNSYFRLMHLKPGTWTWKQFALGANVKSDDAKSERAVTGGKKSGVIAKPVETPKYIAPRMPSVRRDTNQRRRQHAARRLEKELSIDMKQPFFKGPAFNAKGHRMRPY